MSNTSAAGQCPGCGAEIPAEAPQGLCPKCLLEGVSSPTEGGDTTGEAREAPPIDFVAAGFPELEIIELIGQGGMGFVYKARQPKLDRHVALKILPERLAEDAAFRERFAREGRVLASLNHPNIVTVYDFGEANGFFYLMMEFVDGVNLRQAMNAGRFTPGEALKVVPHICDALQFAHGEGVLHRDIKPANILLDSKGRVKIADFGIAEIVGESKPGTTLTGSGYALGTPHYMAPEQIEKPNEVDHRADIYSLGVVFYELLTGELPLGRFALPSEKSPVSDSVDDIVLRALAKERERRQQSADELKTEVEGATRGGALRSGAGDAGPGGTRVIRRWSKAVASGAAVNVLALAPAALLMAMVAMMASDPLWNPTGPELAFTIGGVVLWGALALTGLVLGVVGVWNIDASGGRMRSRELGISCAWFWPVSTI
jgi:tRNA A-37 threonylcarbamoyl transferase component Bud32